MSQKRLGDGSSGSAPAPFGAADPAPPLEPGAGPTPRGPIPRPAAPGEENLRLVPPVEDLAAAPTVPPGPMVPPPGPDAAGYPSTPGWSADADAPTSFDLPPWPPAPDVAGSGEGSSGRGRGLLVGVLVAVAVLAGQGAVFWSVHFQDQSDGAASVAAGNVEPVPPVAGPEEPSDPFPPSPTSPEPTAGSGAGTPEEAALAELERLRAQSLAGLVLDGRWVAQLAAKTVGITDPLQTAQNGTSTFYAVDILAESVALRSVAADPSQVLVLQSVDYGQALTAPDGQAYWATLVDGGFGSRADVEAWCAQTYPGLEGVALADVCVPRTLTPPHP